ncbi:MAG: DASH family cryptochrome [Opitutaceae bacterium]|nr:DASH family cryptochrome [Cytophagales bacterium]
MQRSIVWFKTDLRLHDNETLFRAIEQSHQIIPVYCFDEKHFQKTEFGFSKTGKFRTKFLLESLIDLDKNLRTAGSGLIVLKGKPEVEIPKIAREFEVQKIYAKKEVAYEENKTEELVENELWKTKCSFNKFSTSTLYHAEDLPFTIKDIPDVFTNFRKSVERDSSVRPVFLKPKSIKSPEIPITKFPSLKELGSLNCKQDERAPIKFKGGETEALKRLNYYFFKSNLISTYKETRNGMVGESYSTKFSPWLSLGCISPRHIYLELKQYEKNVIANDSTYWLEFELLWRDYFRFMMKKYRNKFFQQNGIKTDLHSYSVHNQQLLENWVNGETGNDFIDANMIELKSTGFLSNRGRQNVSSYFCNELKLDWRYGAAYFEQQLIDYDVCSNWGNWAYLAGVGNDPRGNRIFNIEKQASEYDPDKTYRKLWLQQN